MVTPARPLKIKLRRPEQQEQQPEQPHGQDPLVVLINSRTLEEEEQEDKPTKTLIRRKWTSDESQENVNTRACHITGRPGSTRSVTSQVARIEKNNEGGTMKESQQPPPSGGELEKRSSSV